MSPYEIYFKKSVLKLILLSTIALGVTSFVLAQGEAPDLISGLITNPKTLISFAIQFFLGLGLGYYSAKVFKYILALAGILVVGVLLNVWSLGGGIEEFASKTGLEWSKIYPLLQSLATALGIMTTLPIGLGFFIGLVVAMRK